MAVIEAELLHYMHCTALMRIKGKALTFFVSPLTTYLAAVIPFYTSPEVALGKP